MAVDTPAKIAILGAGPVGLEAALYARYLGYDVDLYESGTVAQGLRRAGHIRALEPWRAATTSLGRASLENQDSRWKAPAHDAALSNDELADAYFDKLAQCDLLADCLQQATVVAVGREGLHRGDFLQDERRIDVPFRLIVADADGERRVEHADVVFDCTGNDLRAPLGNGGMTALGNGELSADEYGLPDILGNRRADFAGKHTLVAGDGLAAAEAVVNLAKLAAEHPQTRITWVTRSMPDEAIGGPVTLTSDDPLPRRAELAKQANALAAQSGGILDFWPSTHVESVDKAEDGPITIEFSGLHAGHATFDRIIAAVPPRPDVSLWSEMQMLVCPALEAPLPMADFLRRQTAAPSPDAASRRVALAQALLNPEPDFYVLGSKSWGRRGDEFTFAEAHEQIVALFTIIGDRESLDLYASRFPTS
ncbi:MAG: hypothetical protein JNK76_05505 [Planctomycetales bacterium]|nr:hypothetical protein [Planctomycetales bacterium]MBN8627957.1 hypothetical protein [Planctomycetota bacterium]